MIDEIFDQARFLKVKCQEECDSYYDNDGFNYYYDYDAPYVKEITDENRDNFKDNENYKNSKYVLVKPDINVKSQAELEFFKDDDELILFGLRKHEIGTGLLSWNKEILIPNYQINQWIVKNHELELIKKDSLGQTDELNEPKMKM
ncbi:hypothetical protein [Mesomycoplasma ovipneumoniae]|uniref:hypothetical protein n=1 Tax=Mesomycoplasma ovipneumoniae TaxID=29562 RepID=UPI00083E6DB1|nr:hypothetical protein [Mesomycoplasma ovipneumoniae]